MAEPTTPGAQTTRCALCGAPIEPDTPSEVDDLGHPVHAECLADAIDPGD
jgi:hypothetical protein